MEIIQDIKNDISRFISYKERIRDKTVNPAAHKAIEMEVMQLKIIFRKMNDVGSQVDDLIEKLNFLKAESANLEDAKAIAEMVSMIHGVPDSEIQNYYNAGLEYTLEKLEQLSEQNQLIIPGGLKKYFKK